MPERDFAALQSRLVDGGITAAHARRIADELTEHWQDLCDEAARYGLGGDDVRRYADDRVGPESDIATVALARRELKGWAYRYPNVARLVLPLACLSLLPAVPLAAGVTHAPQIARWSASLMLSALFTATLMLILYLAILATGQTSATF